MASGGLSAPPPNPTLLAASTRSLSETYGEDYSLSVAAGWRGLTAGFEDFGWRCRGVRSEILIGRAWLYQRMETSFSAGGKLIVLKGGSSTGKTTICRHLVAHTKFYKACSIRKVEVIACHFLSPDRPETMTPGW